MTNHQDYIQNLLSSVWPEWRITGLLGKGSYSSVYEIIRDDLGSGYTALANLCDYPIDVVKIDRGILLKTDTKRGKELFSGIVALAHSLNMPVICEGVETEEQNTLVSDSDCDYIQGWYYSKPKISEGCEDFIRVHTH